jgi:hypothetical protein
MTNKIPTARVVQPGEDPLGPTRTRSGGRNLLRRVLRATMALSAVAF